MDWKNTRGRSQPARLTPFNQEGNSFRGLGEKKEKDLVLCFVRVSGFLVVGNSRRGEFTIRKYIRDTNEFPYRKSVSLGLFGVNSKRRDHGVLAVERTGSGGKKEGELERENGKSMNATKPSHAIESGHMTTQQSWTRFVKIQQNQKGGFTYYGVRVGA